MLIARMSTSVNTDSFHCIFLPFLSRPWLSPLFFTLSCIAKEIGYVMLLCCARLPIKPSSPLPGLRERQHRSKSSKHTRHILLYKKRSQRRNLSHMHFSSAFLLFCLNRQKRRVLFHANLFIDCLKWVIVHWASWLHSIALMSLSPFFFSLPCLLFLRFGDIHKQAPFSFFYPSPFLLCLFLALCIYVNGQKKANRCERRQGDQYPSLSHHLSVSFSFSLSPSLSLSTRVYK